MRTIPVPVEVVDGDVYAALHTLIDKLFDGEVDINVFEEQTRFWFGTSAYILYTIDKLVHNLAKHVIILATDPRCIKLYQLFARESDPSPALKLGAAYCQKADEQLEDEENLYKIDYDPVAAVLAIELLGESELHHRQQGDDAQAEARWSDYIDNYVKSSTASAAYEPKKPVFLKRYM